MSNIEQKVFIANAGAHDYTDASRYGTVIFVTKGTLAKFGVGLMARKWADALRDSGPNDLIVASSLTTLCAIGAGMFARKHGCLNLLLFRNGKYMERRLMLDQLMEVYNEEEV